MKLELLERLLAANRAGLAAALATDLATGAQCLVTSDDCIGDLALGVEHLMQVRQTIEDDESRTVRMGNDQIFIEVSSPRLRLILIGGVQTAQSLGPMARLVGYEVTVVDPRAAFASPARFPDTHLVTEWPEQAVRALKPNRRTALVTLTHNAKIDDAALAAGLQTDAFYIGALGSRRTHAKRCERLGEAGFDAVAVKRIRGPVGLPIGALTPGEIAIAIMAEITAALRRSPLATRTTIWSEV